MIMEAEGTSRGPALGGLCCETVVRTMDQISLSSLHSSPLVTRNYRFSYIEHACPFHPLLIFLIKEMEW